MSSLLSGALPVADRDALPLTACFSVHADAEPGVMPRVLELFAKRGLVPRLWHSAAAGTALTIDVQIGGLGRDTVDYIAHCLRQIVGVEAVLTTERRAAG
jgi:acetolactate synthase regulatory subunit